MWRLWLLLLVVGLLIWGFARLQQARVSEEDVRKIDEPRPENAPDHDHSDDGDNGS